MGVGSQDPGLSDNMVLALLQTWEKHTQGATLQCPHPAKKDLPNCGFLLRQTLRKSEVSW